MKHTELALYFPPNEWNVYIETNPIEIVKHMQSSSVTAWGQGPIGETGYYELVTTSPQSKGSKRLAIVATVEEVKKAQRKERA